MTDEMVLTYSLRMTNPQSHDMEMTGSAVVTIPMKPLEETKLVPPASRPKPPGLFAYNLRALVLHSLVTPSQRTDLVQWEYKMEMPNIGNQQVVCLAGRNELVPHGQDENILQGVINAYVENGCPADGTIQMTVAQFLAHAGLKRKGGIAATLHEGLQRLQQATYRIKSSTYDQRREKHRWTEEQFSLIDSFRFYDEVSLFEYVGQRKLGTVMKVRLSGTLMASLKGGHILALQRSRFSQMSVHTRMLYGMLYELVKCHREINGYDTQDVQISFKLPEWADFLHIAKGTENVYEHNRKVKTVLENTSKELLDKGVIRTWEIDGPSLTLAGTPARRVSYTAETRLKYTVRGDIDTNLLAGLPDDLMAELRKFKLSSAKLEHISSNYSAEYVRQCLSIYKAYSSAQTIDRPAGAILDIIEHPSKYDGWLEQVPPEKSGSEGSTKTKAAQASPTELPRVKVTLESARSALHFRRKEKTKETEELFEKVVRLYADDVISVEQALDIVTKSKSEMELALNDYLPHLT